MTLLLSTHWTPTPEFWALMTLIVGGFTKFLYQRHKDIVAAENKENDRKAEVAQREADRMIEIARREQDRLDLAAVASLTVEQLASLNERIDMVDANGRSRLKVLIGSNVTTRAFAKKAIDSGNHITEKFNTLTQALIESKSYSSQNEADQSTEQSP